MFRGHQVRLDTIMYYLERSGSSEIQWSSSVPTALAALTAATAPNIMGMETFTKAFISLLACFRLYGRAFRHTGLVALEIGQGVLRG